MVVVVVMMMIMILGPNEDSLAFTPPGDEMSEVVSRCLPHRQLWVRNLSKIAMQRLEVNSNCGYKAQNIPLHHHVSIWIKDIKIRSVIINYLVITSLCYEAFEILFLKAKF